jgi:putative glutamine amidotransferase
MAVRLRFVLFIAMVLWPVAGLAEGPAIGLLYPAAHFAEIEAGQDDPLELYTAAIEENGGVRIALGQNEPPALQQAKLAALKGLILPGGIDVAPYYYGEPPHEKLEKTDGELDQFEFRILGYAVMRALPVLGICRGHQLMNVYFGGSLFQDIPDQVGAEVIHRQGKPPMHPVAIAPDSLMRELFGVDTLVVNSYHHQSVKTLAPGFRATAHTADGVVEAMESTGTPFMLGVQFHPEKLREEHPLFNAPFARLVAEAHDGAQGDQAEAADGAAE